MTEKTRRSAAIVIGVLLLILLLASSGPAAWATPGQDQLRQTIPGDFVIFIPCLIKSDGLGILDGPACWLLPARPCSAT